MANDPNSVGDYVEEYEEINDVEEYDDVDENGDPIIEYEDDGYDDDYDEEYAEDDYDDGYDDEYAEDEEYDDEEYDDGGDLPAAPKDTRLQQLLTELETVRDTSGGGHGLMHSYNLSELSRLRDETLKNNLQNQITYNNSIFNEIQRLKDDVTRNQADSRLQYEIMQLRNEMKSAPVLGLPQTSGGGVPSQEYFRDQIRNEIRAEINALKDELKAERTERQSRQDIDRLKAQIAQLQKGQGKQGFNSGEETGGAAFPSNGHPAQSISGNDCDKIFREIKALKDDFNHKIDEIRNQSERIAALSIEIAERVENEDTKRLLTEILTEMDTNAKMAEAKSILSGPVDYTTLQKDFENFNQQFSEIRTELRDLSDMTALVRAASLAPDGVKQNLDEITTRIDELELDLDELVEAGLIEGAERRTREPKPAEPVTIVPDPMMIETLHGLSSQLNDLQARLQAIADEQQRQQYSFEQAFATQAEEATRTQEVLRTINTEDAKTLAAETAHTAAQQGAAYAAEAAQKAALAEVANLNEGINSLKDELLSVTNDQSQAMSQYMQFIANEVTALKTTLDSEVTALKGDLDKQTQSVFTALHTISEPTIQQASNSLDADTAEALNAVLNDIRLNISQNQEEVNRSLAANLESIKQLLADFGAGDNAQAAVDRAALMEAVNDIRTLSYNQIEAPTTGDPVATSNDISEILNEINLLRQDIVHQTTSSAANNNEEFLQQFGAAVMEDFQYLKDEVAALSSVDQSAAIKQLVDEFNELKAIIAAGDNSNADSVLTELSRLSELVAEQNTIMEAQNSIAEGQAAESAAQAEAISAIRDAISSLPDEFRLTVAGSQDSQAIENLSIELSVLRTMVEEQSKQIPSTETLEGLSGQINSIRMLIGENPTLAADYNSLNDLSTEIAALRTSLEGKEYPDNTEAFTALQNEINEVKELIGTSNYTDALFAIREDIDSVKTLVRENSGGGVAYAEFTQAMEELRTEIATLATQANENYTEILTAAQTTLEAAQQAADAATTIAPLTIQGEQNAEGINENLTALRDELANRLVPDTFVVMDALKDFRTELENNLAVRDEERTQQINEQIAAITSNVAEYTAPNSPAVLDEAALEFIKGEIKSAKDAVLYSIYRDNQYADSMREDLAYLSDQLYYISESMLDGFAATTSGSQNKDLLLEVGRYIDTLRHDMTNRIMDDADAFNVVSKTLEGLQSELKNMTTDQAKAIAAITADQNKAIAAITADHNKAISALNKENAGTLRETVSSLKSEFKETYNALKLDHNNALANILNILKSLRTDLMTEVNRGRDIDDKRVLNELAVIKNEIAAARSSGISVTEKQAGAVTIEDLKSELTGIAEIVKNNKKSTRTTTTTTRKSTPASKRSSSSTTRRSTTAKKSTSTSPSVISIPPTQSQQVGEEITETIVTTVEDITDQNSTQNNSVKGIESSAMAEFKQVSATEVNEIYEYDGKRYTREQLQLAQALAAKIADKMVIDKLAEQLDEPTVLTIAEDMLKNKKRDK